jgi:hypothetical protein
MLPTAAIKMHFMNKKQRIGQPVLRTSKRRYNRCDSSRAERRVARYIYVLKGEETMQLMLQLNRYFMYSTNTHIEALDAFCSIRHNAPSTTEKAVRMHLPMLRTSKRRYNSCDSSRAERRVAG